MMKYQQRKRNLIRNILIGISLLFIIGCEDKVYDEPFVSIEWDARLPIDENGYYHLEMDRNNFQTIHRINGKISDQFGPREFEMVNWESDLYWVLGDTLGYIVKSGYTDDLVYVAYDTVYVTGFEGELVNTTNKTSYSNLNGEINNMIGPVKTMIGDTLNVGAYYNYQLLKVFSIVLD